MNFECMAPNLKMLLMKYCISLPNLVLSSQNAQLFCYAPVQVLLLFVMSREYVRKAS